MIRRRHLLLLVLVAAMLAFVACTLNPQPLPPFAPEEGDTSAYADGGFSESETDDNAEDAGLDDASLEIDGGVDAGDEDAGDAGDEDASDAGDGEDGEAT